MTDLTKGSPFKVILRFAIPLYIGQIFQLAYGIIDTRIIGSFLGGEALAAVGSVTTLTDFAVLFLNGFINGFGIIISTFFGAKDESKLKNSIAWTIVLGFAIGAVFSVLALVFLNPLLTVLRVSVTLRQMARQYAAIIIAGLVITAAYNICASILRSVGDSLTPLVFLIISNILNGILDYILISKTELGITGAACATLIAQLISAVACFIYMRKKHRELIVGRKDFQLNPPIFRELMSSGFSMSIMISLVQFGTLALQTAINTFGTNIIVAHVAARKIIMICMTPFSCFGHALATYCGQNKGAGLFERIKKGIRSSYLACIIWWGFAVLVIFLFCPLFIKALTATTEDEVIKTGCLYLYINVSMCWVTAGISILRNSMQGLGQRKVPLVSSFIELLGKFLIALIFAPMFGYWAIILSEPVIWCIMVIPLIVGMKKELTRR